MSAHTRRTAVREAPYTKPASSLISAPQEFSIKGSSGPTWLVVSNLAGGTSKEDIQLTFSSFGAISTIAERGASAGTAAYEVAFEKRADAEEAAAKFHGALADGRILQAFVKRPAAPREREPVRRAAVAAAAQRQPPQPKPAQVVAVPTGPASMRSKPDRIADALTKQQPKSLKERLPEPLANRLLTPAQARAAAAKKAEGPGSLKSRISTPLVDRLAPKSDPAALKAQQDKKKRKAAAAKKKAKNTNTMDVDA